MQKTVAVILRKSLLVSIGDLLAVVREFLNPDVSRSGLDRCLRRHGMGNLRDLQALNAPRCAQGVQSLRAGYLPQMTDESSRRYLFVAIDPLPGR